MGGTVFVRAKWEGLQIFPVVVAGELAYIDFQLNKSIVAAPGFAF